MTAADKLLHFVCTELADGQPIVIGADDSLLESGILDSLGIMKLLVFLQEELGVTVDPVDLAPENFETLAAINALIDKGSNASVEAP